MINLIIVILITLLGGIMPFDHTPEGGSLTLEMQMMSLYESAAQDINALAGRAIRELAENPDRRASQFREIRAAQLATEIQSKLDRLGSTSKLLVDGPLKDSINGAIARGDQEMLKLGLPLNEFVPGSGASFTLVAGEAVEVIAEDTIARKAREMESSLKGAMETHRDSAVTLFKSLGSSVLTANNPSAEADANRAIARGLITGNPTIADRAIRELFADDSDEAKRVRKLGNKRIEVGKATMTVRQYAMTVTRTRMREATVEARHRRLSSRGVNLVQITGKNSANFCTGFLGLVCSIGPAPVIDELEVVSLSSLPGGAPPFHPNCSKGTAPYIHGLVSKARQDRANQALKTYTLRLAKGELLKPVA